MATLKGFLEVMSLMFVLGRGFGIEGRRHGKGSMVYDGGMTEYQGGWKWGRQDGQGKIIHKPTGRVEQEGYWKAGKFINADIKFGKSELSSLHSNIRQDTSSNSWY